MFITYSTALRLHNPLYGRALAPANLWPMTHGQALTCEHTHWACTEVPESAKRKFHLSSKSSFKHEAIKAKCGDVWRYTRRTAGFSLVAPSVSIQSHHYLQLSRDSASQAAIRSQTVVFFFFLARWKDGRGQIFKDPTTSPVLGSSGFVVATSEFENPQVHVGKG